MDKMVIEVNKLSKNFGSVQAVKNISFEVKQSETLLPSNSSFLSASPSRQRTYR